MAGHKKINHSSAFIGRQGTPTLMALALMALVFPLQNCVSFHTGTVLIRKKIHNMDRVRSIGRSSLSKRVSLTYAAVHGRHEPVSTLNSDERKRGFSGKESEGHHGPSQFTSEPRKLLLEDTDSEGVMYNGYYIRAYERALRELHACIMQACGGYPVGTSVINRPDFYFTQCAEHKFESSPKLGECSYFIIRGALVEKKSPAEETWKLEMVEHNLNRDNPKVYNSAILTVAIPNSNLASHNTPMAGFGAPAYLSQNAVQHQKSMPLFMPRGPPYNPLPRIFPKETITKKSRWVKCIDLDPRGGFVVSNEEELLP